MFKNVRNNSLLLLGAFALFALGCAGSRLRVGQSAEGEVVEAEGWAPHQPTDLLNTKKASLADAQRNAVEKAVGVYISAKTMVEQSMAIENNILARTEGYVKKYDILKEGPDGEFYKTRIRALVALKDLEAELKSMGLLNTPALKRPRVHIKLSEQIEKESLDDSPAARSLEAKLMENGYVILSDDRLSEAELQIQGKAASFPFQAQGLGGFISYRARITLQVVRAGTSDIVFSYSKEASGLGGSKELAGLKSLETVGELAGTELSERVAEVWSKAKSTLVMVEGVESFEQVERIRKHILAQPGVADLVLRVYDEGMASFEVQLGSIHSTELASQLSNSRTVPLKVVETQPQSIRLKTN